MMSTDKTKFYVLLCGIHKIKSINIDGFIENSINEYLKQDGVVIIQLDKPLSDKSFIRSISKLGVPIREDSNDKALVPYIESDVILNVVTNNFNENISSQPFTKKYLNLHTECSRRKILDQPKYLVFMCCEEGSLSSAQTISPLLL